MCTLKNPVNIGVSAASGTLSLHSLHLITMFWYIHLKGDKRYTTILAREKGLAKIFASILYSRNCSKNSVHKLACSELKSLQKFEVYMCFFLSRYRTKNTKFRLEENFQILWK